MRTVKGTFTGGIVRPDEAFEGREGQQVLITFLDSGEAVNGPEGEDTLGRLIETCGMETGIPDLAQEHDHYLHGKLKRNG